MKILHVIPFLWSGAGNVVTRLCETQCASHDVHIATSVRSKGQVDWRSYRTRLTRAGVVHHRLDTFDRAPEVLWRSVAALAAIIEREAPDVLHAHAGVPAAVCGMARDRMRGRRPRLVAHMYSWAPGRPAWMDDMDTWAFARADAVVVSARSYARLLREAGVPARRLHYVPWGLEMTAPAGDRKRAATSAAGTVTIGFVGRIELRKRQLDLVNAVAHLARTRRDVKLVLIGPVADEAYAARIEQAIARGSLAKRVEMTGRVPDVAPHVRSWDLFVSLSSDEGQGVAILEAMAMGVPVASVRVAGVEDYLTDRRTGRVLRDGGARALAAQLDALLAEPAALAAVARRAATHVRTHYGWPRTMTRIHELYSA